MKKTHCGFFTSRKLPNSRELLSLKMEIPIEILVNFNNSIHHLRVKKKWNLGDSILNIYVKS